MENCNGELMVGSAVNSEITERLKSEKQCFSLDHIAEKGNLPAHGKVPLQHQHYIFFPISYVLCDHKVSNGGVSCTGTNTFMIVSGC